MAKSLIALAVFCTAYFVSADDQLSAGELKIRFYHGLTTDEFTDYPVESAEKVVDDKAWKSSDSVVIYIHGLTGSVEDESTLTIAAAYLEIAKHNVLALDYSTRATLSTAIVKNVGLVGRALGELINRLVQSGVELSSIHLIGFGLGPHVAAHAALTIDGKLARITALDPALPAFYRSGVVHIDKSHARIVDVIHGDSGILGVADAVGTADFYPNSGRALQPGCSIGFGLKQLACSSNKSWYYYAASVRHPECFPAIGCDSWNEFVTGRCTGLKDFLGYGYSQGTNGSFYLQTESEFPFCKGDSGIIYDGSFLKILSARAVLKLSSVISSMFE